MRSALDRLRIAFGRCCRDLPLRRIIDARTGGSTGDVLRHSALANVGPARGDLSIRASAASRRLFSSSNDDPGSSDDANPQLEPLLSSDDEWTVLSASHRADAEAPPSLGEVHSVQREAREAWGVEGRQLTKEVSLKYQEAFRLSVIYFRVHHRDLTLDQVEQMLQQFSQLIPSRVHKKWAFELCSDTVLHLLQSYWEKLSAAETLDIDRFAQTIQSVGQFGHSLQRYCIESDPDHTLWRLADKATFLIPSASPQQIVQMMEGFSQLSVFDARLLEEVLLYMDLNMRSFEPQALIQIMDAFAELKEEKFARLLTKLTHVVAPGLCDLSPAELARALWNISYLKLRTAQVLNDALLRETERRLPQFDRAAYLGLLLHLADTNHYPGDRFVQQVCEVFVRRFPALNQGSLPVRLLVALAKLSCYDHDAVTLIKRHLPSESRPLGDVLLSGWSLSILNAFDDATVKWWAKRLDCVKPEDLTDIQKRYMYQSLMHICVLQPDLSPLLDIDPELERQCLEKWRERIRKKAYTSATVLQIFVSLRHLGFICMRTYATFGRRFNISVALWNRTVVRKFCVFCDSGFSNARHKLRGPQLWKQKMLERLGWPLLKVDIQEWEKLNSRSDKLAYLKIRLDRALSSPIKASA